MTQPEKKPDDYVRCLLTNKWIEPHDGDARWCEELSGFVSKRGQVLFDNAEKSGTIESGSLLHIIWCDWWSQDNPQGSKID